MASDDFYPSITPITLDSIPSVGAILKVARPPIQESESWAPGPNDGASWFGRVSEHTRDQCTWDDFWAGFGVNHNENKAEYYSELHSVTCLERISPEQEIWTLHYALQPPISHRVFTVVITIHVDKDENTGLRTGYLTTVPIDVASNPEYSKKEAPVTRGRYTSIERVRETTEGGVNWRVITSSTPGGMIPQWIAEKSIPGKIQEDVPAYLAWMHKRREKGEEDSSAATA